MKTKTGKFYIVHRENKLILDLGLIEEPCELKTKDQVFETYNKLEYETKLKTLEKDETDI